MKRIRGIIAFFILLFIFAKWGPAISFNSTTQTKGEPLVVTGTGKVFVTPNIAKVTLGVEETGTSLKTVQDNANKKSKAITDAVKKLGVGESDIKTTSYSLYPEYDYSISVRKITGYRVSTTYEVTIKDFDKINEVLVAATASGANIAGNVNFEINDKTKKEKLQEAREMAVKEAKEKAEGLAKSASITLGKIINISENQNLGDIRFAALPISGGGVPEKSIEPDIQPGQTEINVNISLSYEIR